MSEFGKCKHGHEMKCLLSTMYCPECESPKNFAEKKEERKILIDGSNKVQPSADWNEGPEKGGRLQKMWEVRFNAEKNMFLVKCTASNKTLKIPQSVFWNISVGETQELFSWTMGKND